MVAEVAQELELGRNDPVPFPETVIEVVVEARLAPDEIGEETGEVRPVIRCTCHGI